MTITKEQIKQIVDTQIKLAWSNYESETDVDKIYAELNKSKSLRDKIIEQGEYWGISWMGEFCRIVWNDHVTDSACLKHGGAYLSK